MKNIAISACLLGQKCRYDASDNENTTLLALLDGHRLIAFCPEDDAFGTPRSTMDLIDTPHGHKAICNTTSTNLSAPVLEYAKRFFDTHTKIDLFIGKDRSPSCGVCSAKLYDNDKNLRSVNESGLMAKEAIKRDIKSIDAERYVQLAKENTEDIL